MPEMEFWEFLLQKEGDRSWLPLESPDVEILEGRYRIVARSNRKNVNIEVRITHQATEEIPPKRRTQKRSNRTNADGLMVVIPFTSLKPGTWELNCSSSLLADLFGNDWQASVQLHVVPRESDPDSWEPDWQASSDSDEPSLAPSEPETLLDEDAVAVPEVLPEAEELISEEILTKPASAATNASVDRLLQIVEQISEANADPASQDSELVPEAASPIALPPLQIALSQETYIAHRAQPITISGRVAPLNQESQSAPLLSHAELKVCLRDPQTSEVLLETCELILDRPLPMPLAFDLMLPSEFKTQLLLGEVKLYDLTSQSEMPSVLANQSFTLTAAADELLEAVASDLVIDEDLLEQLTAPKLEATPDASSQTSPSSLASSDSGDPAKIQSSSFKMTADQPLPPQLYQPTPDQEGKKSLDLPSFSVPTQDDTLEVEDTIAQVSPVQSAFQALNLQNRFLNRLNSLATDAELSEALKAISEQTAEESALEVEQDAPPEVVETPETEIEAAPIEPETLLTQEIVVDDELGVVIRPVQDASAPNPLLLAEDEPVPTPVLEIAAEELVAGRSLLVRAKLPNLLPKFYVKLWINDRQTRILIDGPHWLVDFTPNGLGDLESITQIVVPFGSLDIQLEAIAIEVSTQRESHKVVLDRSVVPPDMPDLSLNEFDA